MFKKLLLAGALVAAPLAMTQTASAQNCYRGYRAPAVTYRAPVSNQYRSYHPGYPISGMQYRSRYGSGYGSVYGSRYGSPYGLGYPSAYPYARRGTSIGVGRGGVNLYFGF